MPALNAYLQVLNLRTTSTKLLVMLGPVMRESYKEGL